MSAMNLNAATYVQTASTTSASITLTDNHSHINNVIMYNAGSTEVFITSASAATTAVFPTSASVPLNGIVLAGGATGTFTKTDGHTIIAMIRASGTGSVYASVGFGE